ncbi:MAG TPA: heme NO-binding domain-containing protein [Rhizomicrobium sp.]|jgi:hypothetical protein|nr:heme NO-binding domain-containing protein [Rhizomicrobium sp.]
MKGIIFNLLEEVVTAQHGEDVWDDLLDATGLTGAYTSLGSYPDAEIEKLLIAGAGALKMPPNEVLRWFGRKAMPLLATRYPAFFSPHRTTKSFVLSVNEIIHPEVRKLYAGAHCPNFRFEQTPDGTLLMGYNSPRKFCALAQGFIEGASDHFGETVDVTHPECMHRGDAACLLSVRTVAAEAADAA